MDMFVVQGGRRLTGQVRVSGAKNAALPIMVACLLAKGCCTIRQVPDLVDVETLSMLLQSLGARVERHGTAIHIEVQDETHSVAEYELVRRMRAGICVLGPLLARRGAACVSLPGGCNIGDRPIDLHLKGLRALGADIKVERGYVIASTNQLVGADIYLGGPFGSTVTGTCNVMSAAILASGRTTIEAAACEPEVVDLGRFLNCMGARISGLGTPFLEIEGVSELNGVDYSVIPDRIEAATLMIASAITGGDLTIQNVELSHLTAVVEKLREVGVEVTATGDGVRVKSNGRHTPTDCVALPYPGIPTDIQAQLMALLAKADGISVVTDKVFPDRFMHAAELARLGAVIRREGPTAIIRGVDRLSGASVMASDLRASAALVLAALAADGESVIRRIYHLDRGYEQLEAKLNQLGARIRRVQDLPENMPVSLDPRSKDNQSDMIPSPHWDRQFRQLSQDSAPDSAAED
jgi:UDP-N-acetylglucosamine 1-carboxyvinyltransferase